MKKTFIIAAALVAMTACNKTLIETPAAEEFGYINLGVTADTEMVVTKAGETDSYLVTIKNNSGSPVKDYEDIEFSTLEYPIKLTAGAYTVEVENFNEEDLYNNDNRTKGAVRVFGSTPVAVVAGGEHSVEVSCTPVNSKVTVAYDNTDNAFTNVFTNPKITVTNSTKAFEMQNGHTDANAVYYNTTTNANIEKTVENQTQTVNVPVAELTWTLTATVANKEKTYKGDFYAPQAEWTKVNLRAGSSGQIIQITITTNDSITTEYVFPVEIDPTTGTENSQN